MDILDELIKNKEYYQELVKSQVERRKELLKLESEWFQEDIEKDFIVMLRYKVTMDLTKRFPVNVEEVMVALEDIDLKGLLC